MSRVGKKLIPLPSGVKIEVGDQLKVQGPKGTLTVPLPAGISVQQNDGKLEILRDSDEHAALHGLTRALAANAVQGVSTGFTRELDIVGIGYRADVKGNDSNVFTGGVGFAPFSTVHVDLMGLYGEDETWGAGAQLSMTF